MQSIIVQAFREIYPEAEFDYRASIKYSGKFKPYNANVKMRGNSLLFTLSRDWKTISSEIQTGLVQELLIRILNGKIPNGKIKAPATTMSMELYNLFMKNVHIAVPKTKTDCILEQSFNRVNELYFNGMLEKPNLQWGNESTRKLGCYEYGSDKITISLIFKNSDSALLDYVMHHEMLHKKFKFESKNGRKLHHSPEFKRMEEKFANSDLMEKEIKNLIRFREQSLHPRSFSQGSTVD